MNRVVLVGRLARDPQELRRSVATNTAAINFTIAVDRQTSKQDNNTPSADFISCVAFNRTAEFVEAYFKKGLLVGVDGKLQSRSYDSKDGRKVYVTEVVCDSVQILEPKNSRDTIQTPAYEQPRQEVQNQYVEKDEIIAPTIDIDDDDLPF